MTPTRRFQCLLPFLLVPMGSGCSSDSGEDCTAPRVDGITALSGTPLSMTIATATVYGSGLLPPETRDGLVLWLDIDDGTSSHDVFTPTEPIIACGRRFSFRVHELPAGTYKLGYELIDAASNSIHPVLSGTSSNDFTLTDGATVEFTPIF